MIAKELLEYMLNNTAIQAVLGTKVDYLSIEQGTEMPYCTFLISDGTESGGKPDEQYESFSGIRFTILHNLKIEGREIAETVRDEINKYRGNMGAVLDSYFQCTKVLGFENVDGSFTFSFDADVRYYE